MNVIDAVMFRAMIRSGAMDLQRHCEEVNSLNVFPVPDGDTGLNMLVTLRGGVDAIEKEETSSLGKVCQALSRGMLLAARGNSGVILSQFFAGLADGLSSLDQANALQFGQAFEKGVKRAYEVVVKPVEGTILTVMREGGHEALKKVDSATTYEEYFTILLNQMRSTLASTPDLLPVLKEAGVIDSGGAGLLYIIEGMGQALGGKIIEDVTLHLPLGHGESVPQDLSGFDENSTLDYGYCTEFILQLTNEKGGVTKFNLDQAIAFLGTIGDSLVAFKDGTLVKVHVHTKEPDKAISYALQYGEFVRFKMENMTLQHHQTMIDKSHEVSMMAKPEAPKKPIGVVAVAPNDEVAEIFHNYGADAIVEGGKFLNPGTEDFLRAFRKANADHLIVFPNNKNEILVAEMAAGMMKDVTVHIIPTGDIAKGLSCCSVVDTADLELEENLSRINATLGQSKTFTAFAAARDSSSYGTKIKKGDFVFIEGEKVSASKTLLEAFEKWFTSFDGEEHSLLTLLYSSRVDEEESRLIEECAASGNDFMDIQAFDAGDTLCDLYAILD